jgi:hypothetical protein
MSPLIVLAGGIVLGEHAAALDADPRLAERLAHHR